jgi:hypothetical protein
LSHKLLLSGGQVPQFNKSDVIMIASSAKESCEGLCDSCYDRSTCKDDRAKDEASGHMGRIKHKVLVGSGKAM